ncbi:MAG TPA: protein kinase [Pirellulales bacterium]|nr:protein kinase [Pirellulales bacterium]
MTNDPPDPVFLPTGQYDDAAINRARSEPHAMPENVGPYRILQRLGGGGMGVVYRAEQRAPMRRDVALKFIKLGMDTRLVIARFEAERQALALMDHPHIAKVFDAGMDDTGRPFFVMEYVKGKPITEYADQNHLSIAERLELFEQVCQAVQHAHHKGVIHRDLKPGNVLVSTQDGRPFAKVIDFGVAKAIARRLIDHTLFTEHDQFIGTPQYMSPEQAEGSVDIDTRTDVYSLGVMLYELLTGSTPFSSQELQAAAFEQIKKMIVEVDPPKPSTRLTLGHPTISTLAASRRTEPKRLGTLVRGELDWIVMKALEKDRKRRYETPTSLANDIQAHLKGEPVQAAPPSAVYRIQKFVRKHQGPVVAVALVGMVLLSGIIGTTWGYYRAERNAELERAAKDRERLAKEEATSQRDAARRAREQAIAATNEAVAAQDRAAGALARSFVRPLVGADALLAKPEIETLWELATLQSDSVGLRMLDEATRDRQMTAQLLNCAEPALVAGIGLNPDLRERALALLRSRLSDQALTLDHRAGIAWLTLMLLDQPGPDSAACVALIKGAIAAKHLSRTSALSYAVNHSDRVAALIAPEPAAELLLTPLADPKPTAYELYRGANALAALSARLPPDAAARTCESAAALLPAAFADPQHASYARSKLVDAFAALSARLPPDAAARVCESASAVLSAVLSAEFADPVSSTSSSFADALVALSARLPSDTTARIADAFLAAVADPKRDTYDCIRLATKLALLLPRLEPEAAARVTEGLLAALADPRRGPIDLLLAASSASVPPGAAAQMWESASTALLADLATPRENSGHLSVLANTLAALSAHLRPDAAARFCESASEMLLAKLADPKWAVDELLALAEELAALSAHLPPDAAARVCGSASEVLLAKLANSKWTADELVAVARELAALSAHVPPGAAARACESTSETLLARLANPNASWFYSGVITRFGQALTALSERLEPVAATRICESASALLLANCADPKRTADELSAAAKELAALSSRLPPGAAARIFRSASDRLFKTFSDEDLVYLDVGSVIIARYEGFPPDPDVDIPSIANVLNSLDALASVSEPMEPGGAKATASRAIRSVTEEQLLSLRSRHILDALVESMAVLSRHLSPPLRRTVLHQLLALRLEQPYEWYEISTEDNDGNSVYKPVSPLVHRALAVMRRQEPHYLAMATPSDGKEPATVSTEHAFSTLKLTTPEIVEFLKSPLTHGDHRRDFLDLLECRYGRRFGNQWAFVEYAQAENLGLDFTTRVKRPDPKAILKTIHKLIDEELAKP